MGAPVVHWEINTRDAQKTSEFYSKLFDWKIDYNDQMQYGMANTGVKMGINGGIGKAQEGANSFVTFYVQVENPQAYLDKAVGLGARVVVPVTEVPNMVTFALFADPEGNTVGIVKGPQTPPPARAKKPAARKRKVVRAKRKAAPKRKKR